MAGAKDLPQACDPVHKLLKINLINIIPVPSVMVQMYHSATSTEEIVFRSGPNAGQFGLSGAKLIVPAISVWTNYSDVSQSNVLQSTHVYARHTLPGDLYTKCDPPSLRITC